MMGRHIFQSFWNGGELSPYERLCLKSFIDHGHRVALYTFHHLTVPIGVELRDASELIPESEYFVYKEGPGAGSPSAFSNLFRYKLLATKGGWWIDTDVICLANSIPKSSFFAAYESLDTINGAVLFAKKKDPLINACLTASST